jgi:hypothetical protein
VNASSWETHTVGERESSGVRAAYRESQQKARFPHSRITDQHELEQVIVVTLDRHTDSEKLVRGIVRSRARGQGPKARGQGGRDRGRVRGREM